MQQAVNESSNGDWSTVYGYFRQWSQDWTWTFIHETLRDWSRRTEGKAVAPTTAVIDSLSNKRLDQAGESGYDVAPQTAGYFRVEVAAQHLDFPRRPTARGQAQTDAPAFALGNDFLDRAPGTSREDGVWRLPQLFEFSPGPWLTTSRFYAIPVLTHANTTSPTSHGRFIPHFVPTSSSVAEQPFFNGKFFLGPFVVLVHHTKTATKG